MIIEWCRARIKERRAITYITQTGGRLTRPGYAWWFARPSFVYWVDAAISDEDLHYLTFVPRLEGLELGNTRITDRGMIYITQLPDLRYLFLYGTCITDNAIPSLATLRSLRLLHLAGTSVTSSGARELQTMLPDCKIALQFAPT